MANPISQTIDLDGNTGKAAGHISCVTNAGWTQQAVVTVKESGGKTVASGTFQGKGEGNVQTPLLGGGTVLSYADAQLPLTLNVQFNYDPNGTFQPNEPGKVLTQIQYDTNNVELITVTSEDYVDNDFNDLILTSVTLGH